MDTAQASAIAAALGWTFEETQSHARRLLPPAGELQRLEATEEPGAYLWMRADAQRLHVYGNYPEAQGTWRHSFRFGETPHISVDIRRAPVAIAKDIERRLLPV